MQEIIYELEEKAKAIPGATIEFFDPPAVPGFGAAGGFALQMLDKNPDGTYATTNPAPAARRYF